MLEYMYIHVRSACITMATTTVTKTIVKGALLPGYKLTIHDPKARKRYEEKLLLLDGNVPYEIPRSSWKDDVDLWPSLMYIHVGMYLVLSTCPYTGEDLLNYKSLECYQRLVAGWVREVLVSVTSHGHLSTDSKGMWSPIYNCMRHRHQPLD